MEKSNSLLMILEQGDVQHGKYFEGKKLCVCATSR
mgnify:CR=1 FL=1